jgi:hypothetical protein
LYIGPLSSEVACTTTTLIPRMHSTSPALE